MSVKNIFSYYEASSYKHKQKPQSNQAIWTQNTFMIPTQQKSTTTWQSYKDPTSKML